MRLSCPGKSFLLGEYAVLEGAPALVAAVNRRAFLEPSPQASRARRDLVAFARQRAAQVFNLPLAPLLYRADTDAFSHQRHKLGLGSSAAVTVLAVASVASENRLDIHHHAVRLRIWEAAFDIHNAFQNAVGSGGDLAASLFGGLLVINPQPNTQAPRIESLTLAQDAHLSFVYTGKSASTSELVKTVQAFKARHPGRYSECIETMRETAKTALSTNLLSAENLQTAFATYGRAMDHLGRISGAPIITNPIRQLMQLADKTGGTAKPSGAGGGDLIVAVFDQVDNLSRFEKNARENGFFPLSLKLDSEGLTQTASHQLKQRNTP